MAMPPITGPTKDLNLQYQAALEYLDGETTAADTAIATLNAEAALLTAMDGGAAAFSDTSYANLNAAVTAIGATVGTLYVSTANFPDGANTTVPATLVLKFVGNGSINQTHNLTIVSDASGWPLRKVFTGSGTLSFTGNKSDTFYPQWRCVCDGTTDDTTAYSAFLAAVPDGCKVMHVPGLNMLLSSTVTLTERRSITICSPMDARNFSTFAPQFRWGATGGTMFSLVRCQEIHFEGHYFKVNSTKSVDTFIKIDGSGGGQISTQNTIRYNSFDASAQSNASAILISISPVATSNNENMEVSYNDFNVSSGSGATAAGIAIQNSPAGVNPNAKHQKFYHNQISNAAIGIYQGNGSCDIYYLGGGSNGVDIKFAVSAEPCRIAYLVAENSKMAIDIANGSGPVTLSQCRFSNNNQVSTGFVKLDGWVIMEECFVEYAPPVGGIVFQNAGTGNLNLFTRGNKYWISGAGLTMAQLGFDLLYATANLAVMNDYGITDSPTGFAGNFSNQVTLTKTLLTSETAFSANDTTPSVYGTGTANRGGDFVTANSSNTSITTFDDGWEGQLIRVRVNDTHTTFVNGATLVTGSGANLAAVSGIIYTFIKRGTVWSLLAYSPGSLSASDIGSGTLAVARGGTGDTGSAWTTYTPTVTANVGTFTTVSATGRYKTIGKTVFIELDITITTNGTAAGYVQATLPVSQASFDYFLVGREYNVTGFILFGIVSGNSMLIGNYDNTYPGGTGRRLKLSGVYEAA